MMADTRAGPDSTSRVSGYGSVAPGEEALRGPLAAHLRRCWALLGVDSCRAWILDPVNARPLAGRWMNDSALASGVAVDLQFDAGGPGVAARVQDWLRQGALERVGVVSHMLSPRRWLLCWADDNGLALLAQLHFANGQTSLDADAIAGVQVLTEHWLAEELLSSSARAVGAPWDRVDRRRRAPPPAALFGALAALLLAAAAGVWLCTVAEPRQKALLESQHAEQQRLAVLAENAMLRGLAQVLVSGDYGEVQELLEEKAALGVLRAAVVVNPREQSVAQIGAPLDLRPGQNVAPKTLEGWRRVPLIKNNQVLGHLLISGDSAGLAGAVAPAGGAAAQGAQRSSGLMWAGTVLLLIAGAAAAHLGWHLKSRYQLFARASRLRER